MHEASTTTRSANAFELVPRAIDGGKHVRVADPGRPQRLELLEPPVEAGRAEGGSHRVLGERRDVDPSLLGLAGQFIREVHVDPSHAHSIRITGPGRPQVGNSRLRRLVDLGQSTSGAPFLARLSADD